VTAEIAIMNKIGIAMAADSAVTVNVATKHGEKQKAFNSSTKLFTISKYQPIGLMIYGEAEILGVPWETIIKLFRENLGKTSKDSVKEYSELFIRYLNNFNFNPDAIKENFSTHVAGYFSKLSSKIKEKVKEKTKEIGYVILSDIGQIISLEREFN
jgi:hypothetical protein